jgi:Flp pilus assembly protein TadG
MTTGTGLRERAHLCVRKVARLIGHGGEEGASLLEFAVTLPLFMIVLCGTASFSLGLYYLQQLGNATSTAAQLLGAEAGLLTDPCATVVSSVQASLPSVDSSKLSYSVTITDSGGTAHNSTSTSCTSLAAYMSPNEPVTVTVTYAYSWLPIPQFPTGFFHFSFNPTSNLVSSQTALAE